MTVLDEFILLFKSDAVQTSKDIETLEKKIEDLKKKGKGRSEQENKDLKESIKQHKELLQQLKDTDEQYGKIADSVGEAVAAFISLKSASKGVLGSAEVNSNLEIQAKLLGQSVESLKAYDAAVQAAGGQKGEFANFYQQTFERNAAVGVGTPSPEVLDARIRTALKLAHGNQALETQVFQRFGINNLGLRSFFAQSQGQHSAEIDAAKERVAGADAAAKTARDFEAATTHAKTALDSLYTTVGNDLLPIVKHLVDAFTKLLGAVNHSGAAEAAVGTGIVASTVLGGAGLKRIGKFLGLGGATAAGTAEAAAGTVGIAGSGGIGLVALGIYEGLKALKDYQAKDDEKLFNDTRKLLKGSREKISLYSIPIDQEPDVLKRQRILRYGGKDPYDSLNATKTALSSAANSQLGSSGVGAKNITVNVGDVQVNTSATTSSGIATSISQDLKTQIRNAVSNIDDGVNY